MIEHEELAEKKQKLRLIGDILSLALPPVERPEKRAIQSAVLGQLLSGRFFPEEHAENMGCSLDEIVNNTEELMSTIKGNPLIAKELCNLGFLRA